MSGMYENFRPRPAIDRDSEPFWAAAAQERLVVQRCEDCGKPQFYPRALCAGCWSDRLTWQECSGLGSVYSFSVVHRPAEEGFPVPYVIALVDLAEGPRLPTNLVGVEPGDVRVGMAVRVEFISVDEDLKLPVFHPLQENPR